MSKIYKFLVCLVVFFNCLGFSWPALVTANSVDISAHSSGFLILDLSDWIYSFLGGLDKLNNTVAVGLSSAQKLRAEQLTSLFENSTIELQYAYSVNLDDGRGFTAGRAGFTTATGDAYEVVKRYTDRKNNNVLAKYLPELKKLAIETSDDVSHLQGFAAAWASAAKDMVFRSVQDEVVDEYYYQPSALRADQLGLKTALAKAVLYDTIIQHGEGDDYDGLPALIERANVEAGGSPKEGIDEKTWLSAFLKIRRAALSHAHDSATRAGWAESVSRCDVYSQIAAQGNYDLHGPIVLDVPDYQLTIP